MSTKTIIFTVKSKHRCGFDVVAEKEEAEEKAKELLRKKAELEETEYRWQGLTLHFHRA